jgi:alcohol dehydrogenase
MNALYRFLLRVPNGAQLKELATFYESGSIKPVIDKTYGFDSSIQALEYLSKGRAKGKVKHKVTYNLETVIFTLLPSYSLEIY